AGTIASLLGFIIGGALVEWHLPVAMYIDAATFLTSGILLLAMKGPALQARSIAPSERRGFFHEFAAGVRYLQQHHRAIQMILLMFLFWCCGAIILNGLTGIITKTFLLDLDWYGYFMGLVGIGMLLGAASCSLARRGIPKEFG